MEEYGKYKVFRGTDGMTRIITPSGKIFLLEGIIEEKDIYNFIWRYENMKII